MRPRYVLILKIVPVGSKARNLTGVHVGAYTRLRRTQLFFRMSTSVSGRFSQNVLHPVKAICRVAGISLQFGDFKICNESRTTEKVFTRTEKSDDRKILDYVATNPGDNMLRFVGEAKTPWMHDLETFIDSYVKENKPSSLQKAFGE